MTPAENLAPLPETGAPSSVEPAAEAGPFVINLCSSSTPMALPRADLPDLKRFTFFVSRRFEEGRERFRLHMGFFATQAEAESWLGLVREVYPGAWTGEAPGKKLRARAVAAAEAQAAHAAGPHSAAPQVEPTAPPPAAVAGVSELTLVEPDAPTVTASPPAAEPATAPTVAQPAIVAAIAPAPAVTPPVLAAVPLAEPVSTPSRPVPTLQPLAPAAASPAPQRGKAAAPAARQARPAAAPKAAAAARKTAVFDNSNIKEVLASLDEPRGSAGETQELPLPGAPLSDAQALQCLEGRVSEAAKPAAFAVQLKWSVEQIALDKLPPLAIFSAYTLYCVEGSREGRKWYGLRLGFFNDPISAKQVAAYVRSEFGSAAVVPVSTDERQRVSGEPGAVPLRPVRKASEPAEHEIRLFDADAPARAEPATPPPAPVRELRPIPFAKRAASGTKVHARERRAPQTLEETLEILGAHELTIDDGRDADEAGKPGQSRKVERSTPFTRLLERLGERVRKN